MTRWFIEKSGTGIEKSGTGIEKSGTGIEKSGTGIEKSGTGIEKSGTGIEKSGTGIRQILFAIAFAAISFASHASVIEELSPNGAMTIVIEDDSIAVSWIIDGSVFSGVSSLNGTFANLALTEIGLAKSQEHRVLVAGSGSGSSKDVAGAGSGSSKDVAGSGSGKEVAGSGSGQNIAGSGSGTDVAGAGSGIEIAGSGSGQDVAGSGSGRDVAGSGSGADVAGSGSGQDIAGSGSGSEAIQVSGDSSFMVAGAGSGADAIVITLPGGTDMQMEVALACNSATVSIMDSNFVEVVSFSNVPVFGASGYCSGGNRNFGFNDGRLPSGLGDGR